MSVKGRRLSGTDHNRDCFLMPDGPRLTLEQCHAKAAECRDLSERARKPSHRVMLEHMAETWERICEEMKNTAAN
jgi:hypothetical protein